MYTPYVGFAGHIRKVILCLMRKRWNVSHILLIVMSCEMYTPYVGFAGILLDIIIYVKIEGIPFVIDLSNIFTPI